MEIQFDDLDNLFETTLDGDLTETATTINLVDVPANTSEGFLAIDADDKTKIEFIHFTLKGAGFVSVPASGGRGQGGTAVQEHSNGAVVRMYVMREHIKGLLDRLADMKSGWIPCSEIFSAVDANTISIAGVDLTGVLQKGDKIKVTNNSAVKYYYISSVPVFATDTTFDVSGEVDLVAGAITLPFFSKIDSPQGFKKGEIWYKARTKRQSTQTLNDNTVTKVQLNSEDFDPNSNFDSATNYRYTAPISGHYEIGYQAMIYDTASSLVECSILIYKNGVAAISNKQVNNASAPGLLFTITGVTSLFLNKGDYIELFAWGNTIDNASFVVSIGGNEQSFLDIKFLSV